MQHPMNGNEPDAIPPAEATNVGPDAVPVNPPEAAPDSSAVFSLPQMAEGRIGAEMAKLAWRARMRWLDDGGR